MSAYNEILQKAKEEKLIDYNRFVKLRNYYIDVTVEERSELDLLNEKEILNLDVNTVQYLDDNKSEKDFLRSIAEDTQTIKHILTFYLMLTIIGVFVWIYFLVRLI